VAAGEVAGRSPSEVAGGEGRMAPAAELLSGTILLQVGHQLMNKLKGDDD